MEEMKLETSSLLFVLDEVVNSDDSSIVLSNWPYKVRIHQTLHPVLDSTKALLIYKNRKVGRQIVQLNMYKIGDSWQR